jgi:predicted RecB family nuclease
VTIPTATPGPRYLTKREFLAGLQCHKYLWWRVHERDAPELTPSPHSQAVMETGRQIGILARDYVPGGQLISFRHQATSVRADATGAAMAGGATALYQGTFARDGIVVQADILERNASGWTLVEVTSTVDVKEKQLADAAIQARVLRRSGVALRRIEIMHLNRECNFPDLSNLFVREDVTNRVAELEAGLEAEILGQLVMLEGPLPHKETGDHCSQPDRCPFWDRCWSEMVPHHVSTVYRAGLKSREWAEQGWQTIFDLPDDLPLGPVARRQVAAVKSSRIQVDSGLAAALEALVQPLAFLDFEAVAPAIPRWPGCGPYEAVPVQLSCHLEEESGQYRHLEWLANSPEDPRPALAQFLIECCAGARTIVAYNAAYEADCLRHLAKALPQWASELADIERRLVDLLPLVRDYVYHPGFQGSFSLKRVLPGLVPELRYEGMDIAEGRTASGELAELLFSGASDPQERSMVREALLAYCKQDTWAMVCLLRRLRELAIGS